MDFQSLFLSANGRIGRQEFWIGSLILFAAHFVAILIPFVNFIVPWFLLYCSVCVQAKRLHDMGKSGWLITIPFGVSTVGVILALIFGGAAIISAGASHQDGDAGSAGAVASFGIIALIVVVISLLNLGFLLWIGLTPSQIGDNRFGSPSPTTTGTVAPTQHPAGGDTYTPAPASPPAEPPAAIEPPSVPPVTPPSEPPPSV